MENYTETYYSAKQEDYYSHERNDMFEFLPDKIYSALDVGCSGGQFGISLKRKFDCKVVGVEPFEEAAHRAAQHLDFVYNNVFGPHLKIDEKFDHIFFNDALEHMIDPWSALEYSSRLLEQNGRVIASIPNIRCYSVLKGLVFNGDWEYKKSGILDKTHLRFFTKSTIEELFKSSGFKIVQLKGMHSVEKYSKSLRIINFLFGKKFSDLNYISYGVVAEPIK